MLSFGSRLKLQTTQAMIVACCVLHNLACDNNDVDPPDSIDIILPDIENINNRIEQEIEQDSARQHLLEEYFARL